MLGSLTDAASGPSVGRRLPGIDLLRAFACLGVYFCHVNSYWKLAGGLPWPLPQLLDSGAHGVDLFMVISGFCLTLPLVRRTGLTSVAVRNFAIRRSTRLLPPYWAALAIAAFFAMSPTLYHHVVAQQAGVGDLVSYALTLQLIIPNQSGVINGSLWSVALEAHLYMVFPILIWSINKFGVRVVLGAMVVVSLLWEMVARAGPVAGLQFGMQLPGRLIQFALGVGCAILVQRGVTLKRRALSIVLSVTGFLAMVMSTYGFLIGRLTMWGLACSALLLLIAELEPKGLLRPVGRFGVFSYSFYLLHQPAVLLSSIPARRITHNPYGLVLVSATVVLAPAMIVSYGFYRMVERPSHQFGRRLAIRSRQLA